MISYIEAILANIPDAKCMVNEETGEIMEWNSSAPIPSKDQLDKWRSTSRPTSTAKAELAATDKEMARIAEDLINVLLNKGLISANDLPGQAASKLNDRANLRKIL